MHISRTLAVPFLARTTHYANAQAPATPRLSPDPGWDLLLLCVAGYIFGGVGRIHQIFPFLVPLKPIVTGLTTILLYALDQRGPRRFAMLRAPTTRFLAFLMLWVALSVPGALVPGTAFYQAGDFVKTVIMFLMIVGSVRRVRDVERLTLAYFLAVVVYSAMVLLRFDVGEQGWRLGHLYYYDANDFGTLTVIAMPLGLYFAAGQRRRSWRLLGCLGLIPIGVAFVWTGSRGAFLSLIIVALFVLFRFNALRKTTRILGTAVLVVGVLVTASEAYWKQMNTIISPEKDYNETEDTGRMKTWERGLGYMILHPVLGVGANNFPAAEGTISPLVRQQEFGKGVRWRAAHSSYVQVAAELGVPGALFFLAFIGSGFLMLRRLARRRNPGSPRGSPLAQALMAALIAWMVGAVFLSLAYTEMLYGIVGLATALHKVTAPARNPGTMPAALTTRPARTSRRA